ncbi:unnamed protein product [Allacma fusca]|uniref:Uncharacterized protein n=1 Tax=Allacma fusca TaxID=39272 RepID=A0A8J2NYW0_9HEXA|nr:unnamed protein product [Allacma fusca]
MSTLAADSKSVHRSVTQMPISSPLSSPMRVDIRSPVTNPDLFDQNTLITYVYCFIKNFIGASGTNAVAIDNKIEQAMDLVKSHLMFAVREEVEVLKEKISELMERITQLEYENTILKANATQETLSQIQGKANQLHSAGGNSNVSNNNS